MSTADAPNTTAWETSLTVGRRGADLWVHHNRGPYLEVAPGPDAGVWLEIESGGFQTHINLTPEEARAVAAHIIELADREYGM